MTNTPMLPTSSTQLESEGIQRYNLQQNVRNLLLQVRNLERANKRFEERLAALEKTDNSEYCLNGPKAGREPWQDRNA